MPSKKSRSKNPPQLFQTEAELESLHSRHNRPPKGKKARKKLSQALLKKAFPNKEDLKKINALLKRNESKYRIKRAYRLVPDKSKARYDVVHYPSGTRKRWYSRTEKGPNGKKGKWLPKPPKIKRQVKIIYRGNKIVADTPRAKRRLFWKVRRERQIETIIKNDKLNLKQATALWEKKNKTKKGKEFLEREYGDFYF